MTSEVKTISNVRRAEKSFTFTVAFTDGTSAHTVSGAQINYIIENSEYQGVPLRVFFRAPGIISDIDHHTEAAAPERRISPHDKPSGVWCRWSGVTVTDDYTETTCPDGCVDSSVIMV